MFVGLRRGESQPKPYPINPTLDCYNDTKEISCSKFGVLYFSENRMTLHPSTHDHVVKVLVNFRSHSLFFSFSRDIHINQ